MNKYDKRPAASRDRAPAVTWAYGRPAVALHWGLALLLTAMAAVGWYMMSIEDEPGSGWYFDLHKSVGLVVAALVLVRLAWRLSHPPAPLPSSVPTWQSRLATATQWLLYALMVAMPLTGYIGASYSEHGVPFFGLATPTWATPDDDTAERFFDIHGVLIWVLVGLVAVHALGALKHLLLDRDGVFQRMGWRR